MAKCVAKIMGVEIRNLGTFPGHDGELCTYGDIYVDTTKVGSYKEDSWGGPINLEITKEKKTLLDDRRKAYYKKFPARLLGGEPLDSLGFFILTLKSLTLDAMNFEKNAKKAQRDAKKYNEPVVPWMYLKIVSLKGRTSYFVPSEEELARVLAEEKPKSYELFRSMADFEIA